MGLRSATHVNATFVLPEWVPGSLSPQELPARGAGAHEARVRELIVQESAFVWRLLRRAGLSRTDADEVVEEVFLAVRHQLAGIPPGSERPFLIGTAWRVLGSRHGGLARQRRTMGDATQPSHPEPPTDDLLEHHRDLAALDRLLARMPLDLRTVFVLFELEGVPESDIARALDLPRSAVASRLLRARQLFHDGARLERERSAAQKERWG